MQGADNTRGFIVQEMYDKVKSYDKEGGHFCQITRERTDGISKRQDSHELIMNALSNRLTMISYVLFASTLLVGGDLVMKVIQFIGYVK